MVKHNVFGSGFCFGWAARNMRRQQTAHTIHSVFVLTYVSISKHMLYIHQTCYSHSIYYTIHWRCLLAESRCLPIFMGISYHRLRHKPVNAGSRPSPWNPLPLKRTCCQCSRLLKNSLSQSMSNFLPLWIKKTEEYIQEKMLAAIFSVHNKCFPVVIQKSQQIKVVPILECMN